MQPGSGASAAGAPSSSTSPEANNPPSPEAHNPSSSRSAPVPKIRRRNRLIQSCLECRRRKLKCSKTNPCDNCIKFKRECLFLSPAMDAASQLKLTEIKEKVGSLERMLEVDAARRTSASAGSSSQPGQSAAERIKIEDQDEQFVVDADDEPALDLDPFIVPELAYEEAENDDDVLDLGIQIGKMRLTERIGGLLRPKIAEEIAYNWKESARKPSDSPQPPGPAPLTPEVRHQYLQSLKPGPNYIAPSSSFFFGGIPQKSSLFDYLPSRLLADRVIDRYFDAVHPVARTVHKPSFMREYGLFWEHVMTGIPPASSMQALIFAVMFSGVISLPESVVEKNFGVSKTSLVENFRTGAEAALGQANFLRSTKLQTLQALVTYLIPLCREEISRSHSVLVGAAIRAGECLGLHRDPGQFGLNALDTHIRRLVWYQLCFLDLRTCEAQGPRLAIRPEDYDTKMPLNVDDEELTSPNPPTRDADRWTDMTLTQMRFECNEFMRVIWSERQRLERRKTTLTACLTKVEMFKTKLAAKYDHLIDYNIPLHKCAKTIKNILTSRFVVMFLFVFKKMPDRLHELLVTTCTYLTEQVNALQSQDPDLAPWSWYVGAFSQQHAAFLLLMEVMQRPTRPDAPRIWKAIDIVFYLDPHDPPAEKGAKVLAEVYHKTTLFQERRKMRVPTTTSNFLANLSEKTDSDSFVGIPQPSTQPRTNSAAVVQYGEQQQQQQQQKQQQQAHQYQQQLQQQQMIPPDEMDYPSSRQFLTTFPGQTPQPVQPLPGPIPGVDPNGPPAEMVFAGVTNGEALWAYPAQPHRGSEGSSGSPSMGRQTGTDPDAMIDIDWEAFDALFPPNQFGAQFDSVMMPPTFADNLENTGQNMHGGGL